ncbi:collagen alpha-1(I) chain-like isoform X1 [Canis lupus familiaris]|uniref:collagen alpha-1(I) chain-like isoform X1 n=1 Tax=Canis lupus familiaris TaxID=9615 RepID=UPI0018F79C5A|nr:collagen alpha-1(I) chain-like isoform X1 [Canis lupus familiaris]
MTSIVDALPGGFECALLRVPRGTRGRAPGPRRAGVRPRGSAGPLERVCRAGQAPRRGGKGWALGGGGTRLRPGTWRRQRAGARAPQTVTAPRCPPCPPQRSPGRARAPGALRTSGGEAPTAAPTVTVERTDRKRRSRRGKDGLPPAGASRDRPAGEVGVGAGSAARVLPWGAARGRGTSGQPGTPGGGGTSPAGRGGRARRAGQGQRWGALGGAAGWCWAAGPRRGRSPPPPASGAHRHPVLSPCAGAAQRPRRLAGRTTRPGAPARPAGRGRRRDPREPRPASPKRRRPPGPEAREPLAAVGPRLWRRLGALEVALAELRAPGGAFLAAPCGRPQPAASQRAWLSWQLAHAGAPLHWAAARLHRLLAAPPGPRGALPPPRAPAGPGSPPARRQQPADQSLPGPRRRRRLWSVPPRPRSCPADTALSAASGFSPRLAPSLPLPGPAGRGRSDPRERPSPSRLPPPASARPSLRTSPLRTVGEPGRRCTAEPRQDGRPQPAAQGRRHGSRGPR